MDDLHYGSESSEKSERPTYRETPYSKRAMRDSTADSGTYRFNLPPTQTLPKIDSTRHSSRPPANIAPTEKVAEEVDSTDEQTPESTPVSRTPEQQVLDRQSGTRASLLDYMARHGYCSIVPPKSEDDEK